LLASTVREAFGPRIDTSLRAVVEEGAPARVLLRHARGSLLLALGRTAHGHWELPAIGTVGRACLRHATVPVVTVPAPDRQPTPLPAATPAVIRSGAA
jgi:nucleotide-binding universal stress UspA family protein